MRTLHTIYSRDRGTCYELVAQWQLDTAAVGDKERHTVSGVILSVYQHSTGYQKYARLLRYELGATKSITATTVPPLWNAKYVPDARFILPSGRLLFTKDDRILFVLFDGVKCNLFVFDTLTSKLSPVVRITEEQQSDLRSLFKSSFSPDDVYWSYALLSCSEFFGAKADAIDFRKFVDTAYLYDLWRDAVKRLERD